MYNGDVVVVVTRNFNFTPFQFFCVECFIERSKKSTYETGTTLDYVIACVEFGQNTDYAPAPLIVFSDVATIRNLNSSL